jgi:hypothetical protein
MVFLYSVIQDVKIIAITVVICDGCSDSETSESGSAFIAQPAAMKLAALMQELGSGPFYPRSIAEDLYAYVLHLMRTHISLLPYGVEYLAALDIERTRGKNFDLGSQRRFRDVFEWINRNLMCTFVGVHLDESGALTLIRGDGGCKVDDWPIQTVNYDNIPPYIANHFIPRQKLEESRRTFESKGIVINHPTPGFDAMYYHQASHVSLFSDGFPTHRVDELWGMDVLDELTQWENTRNMLQKQLRRWWKEDLTMTDDATIAMIQLINQEE